MESISADNYYNMKERISKIPQDDHADGSSNFSMLIQKLETSDISWIDDTNEVLEE